jgi:quercetin dioxygenase-like cupin family protein
MMFNKKNNEGYKSAVEGIKIKTIAHGKKTLMAQFQMAKGADLPLHTHPHEQTGYMISGKLILKIDQERHVTKPGDSWCIAGDVPHSAEVLEDSVVVEVFSPVREDFLGN